MLVRKDDLFLPNGQVNPKQFTASAWRALENSLLAGQQTHWETIRSPHLFMGLLATTDPTIAEWGMQLGVDRKILLAQFRRLFAQEDNTLAPLRLHREFLSQNAIGVLRAANARRLEMDHDQIGAGDLLWAVLAVDGCVTACFAESGIAPPVLRVLLAEAERHAEMQSDLSQSL